MLATRQLSAQYMSLEGQTGGFLTPTAYVVYMEKGEKFSHPAVGFHFINAAKVIGNRGIYLTPPTTSCSV